MGLDAVEIIMNCEDAFDIRIPDNEVEKVRTAGNLHSLVMRLLSQRQGAPACPSSQVFYRLRKALIGIGVPRRLIRPESKVGEIVEELGEARWADVRATLEIPRMLRKPAWAELLVFGGVTVTVFAAKFLGGGILAGIGAGIVAAYVLYLVTLPVRMNFQSNESLRQRIYGLVGGRRRKLAAVNSVSNAEAWQILRGILAEQLGIPMEEIRRESRFIEDLG
jgi:acyl carrier protein